MRLKLERPICGIDVETTGLEKTLDRVIEITVTKIEVNGDTTTRTRRINPDGVPIQQGAFEKHGITEEELKDEPKFAQLAKNLYKMIKGCDFIMYNGLNFDVSFLNEEFLRCGLSIDWEFEMVDPYKIFTEKEPRTLDAALYFYCKEVSEKSHSAEEDVKNMLKVLDAQIEKYGLGNTVKEVAVNRKSIDFDGKISLPENGIYTWTYGKNKGVDVLKDLYYCKWFFEGNFTRDSKNHLTRIIDEAGLTDELYIIMNTKKFQKQ